MAQRKIMKDFSMLGLPNLNSYFILINQTKMAPSMAAVFRTPTKLCSFFVFYLLFFIILLLLFFSYWMSTLAVSMYNSTLCVLSICRCILHIVFCISL